MTYTYISVINFHRDLKDNAKYLLHIKKEFFMKQKQSKLLTPKVMAITLLLTTSTLMITPSFAEGLKLASATEEVQTSAAYDKGYAKGVKSGTQDGYKDGYVGSYKKSYQEAYVKSFQKKSGSSIMAAIHPDFIKGYKKGYQSGYKVGWESGEIDGKVVGTEEGASLGEKDKKNLREEMKQQCSNGNC